MKVVFPVPPLPMPSNPVTCEVSDMRPESEESERQVLLMEKQPLAREIPVLRVEVAVPV